MLSPSQGFCYCLPVRLGALVVSLLAFLGSGILAGVTFRSLAIVSTHITSTQTAGFYLASVSWASLSLFSLLGFISVILQHPLILTIFARFVLYHLPAHLICNLFFTIVLFQSYRDVDAILRSPECGHSSLAVCGAAASLQLMTWLNLFILLPAAIVQSYIYAITKRFIFVVSGEWALEQEINLERQRRSVGKMPSDPLRRTTITQTIGRGRRRAKAELWFTMETPTMETRTPDVGDSFLPSMMLSPMDFPSSPRTPLSVASTVPLMSSSSSSRSPRLGNKQFKSSLPSSKSALPTLNLGPKKEKDGTSDRSAALDMDFSDPDPATLTSGLRSGESLKIGVPPHQEPDSRQKTRESDGSVYSVASMRDIRQGL